MQFCTYLWPCYIGWELADFFAVYVSRSCKCTSLWGSYIVCYIICEYRDNMLLTSKSWPCIFSLFSFCCLLSPPSISSFPPPPSSSCLLPSHLLPSSSSLLLLSPLSSFRLLPSFPPPLILLLYPPFLSSSCLLPPPFFSLPVPYH